ncbi:MAG: aminotransferase class V-fold PLP-dependent enzyme [Armatimonadota bacterium]|nr:aminotransferase class V-fold PLP-dependent enzyme [Armatimonadota bacterium]
MNIDNIRSNFPHLNRFIFLNHAGVSPLPSPVADSMRSLIADLEQNASINEEQWSQRESDLRRGLSALLHCEPSEIAITKNTSEGLSCVANGLNWKPGDNVVISNVEFPANAYPWLALENKGVEVRLATELDDGRIPLEHICRLIDHNTRVVALSLVQYASGYRIPAEELGKYCRSRGILFVLDVFQAAANPLLSTRESLYAVAYCSFLTYSRQQGQSM